MYHHKGPREREENKVSEKQAHQTSSSQGEVSFPPQRLRTRAVEVQEIVPCRCCWRPPPPSPQHQHCFHKNTSCHVLSPLGLYLPKRESSELCPGEWAVALGNGWVWPRGSGAWPWGMFPCRHGPVITCITTRNYQKDNGQKHLGMFLIKQRND